MLGGYLTAGDDFGFLVLLPLPPKPFLLERNVIIVLFSQRSHSVAITQVLSEAKKRALDHPWEWGLHFRSWAVTEGWPLLSRRELNSGMMWQGRSPPCTHRAHGGVHFVSFGLRHIWDGTFHPVTEMMCPFLPPCPSRVERDQDSRLNPLLSKKEINRLCVTIFSDSRVWWSRSS